ncbi:hypothetical protein MTO96_039206 [Rhipicephalus appendiculatus]
MPRSELAHCSALPARPGVQSDGGDRPPARAVPFHEPASSAPSPTATSGGGVVVIFCCTRRLTRRPRVIPPPRAAELLNRTSQGTDTLGAKMEGGKGG